ncbi:hypothetical protein PU74_23315 [Escherichia coli]|nr:hypothetical protein PU74_23315 [Escherichia coli]
MEGETAKSERVNDRKITADGKEGPGDRSDSSYLASRPQKPGYDGGTAQPVHDAEATELKTHKAMPRMAG